MITMKIVVDGKSYFFKGDCLSELRETAMRQVILKTYLNELNLARNKTDAVMNTAALLDLSISHVWKIIKEMEA